MEETMVLNEEKSKERTEIKSEEKSETSLPNPKRIRWALPGKHIMVHLLITLELSYQTIRRPNCLNCRRSGKAFLRYA